MTKKIFITGTGTEVGKTVISRAVTRAFINRGKKVIALKPIESGAIKTGNGLWPEDAVLLQKASKSSLDITKHTACIFQDPVSPHLAAKNEGREIEKKIVLNLLNRYENNYDIIIAEGAGGLLVPLADDFLYGDIIAESGYKLLIVVPDVLGAINSTLCTIEAAKKRRIEITGVIFNRASKSKFGNIEAIKKYGKVKVLGNFPDCPKASDSRLATLAEETIDLDFI